MFEIFHTTLNNRPSILSHLMVFYFHPDTQKISIGTYHTAINNIIIKSVAKLKRILILLLNYYRHYNIFENINHISVFEVKNLLT